MQLRKMYGGMLILFSMLILGMRVDAQPAKISEAQIEFTTYPFSDPDPVPEVGRIYPYFYFNGYTNNAVQQKWKMVVLENEYIKVFVCPDIGGKVWGAIEKSTGKEFLYYNHVVKFRDVAMRGAWTSGGLEYNFGDIGHIPTCATPVDYVIKENEDGSVACVVGAIDLPSGTKWNVEVKVSPGQAFFETKASWFNNTPLPTTYYHWMNAAAKAGDELEFIYPGAASIGHGGEVGGWPVSNGRAINWYKNNAFGSYKSYHVLNAYADYFGGYWHDKDFGFGHYSDFDEKPGKKLWIWGLAEEGMIWEDLLTDSDGQYIEFQAGKLFNQAANGSTRTPFKHKEFAPHDSDIMKEIWFPLKETGGMVAASAFAVLNVSEKDDQRRLTISALQALNDDLRVFENDELILTKRVELNPLELFETDISSNLTGDIKIVLGENKLVYEGKDKGNSVDRPLLPNQDFDWESAYGYFTQGLELEKQRAYAGAKSAYQSALEKEAGFLPALNRMAQLYYRQMDYPAAFALVQKALAIDTYDGEANYLLGLISVELGDLPTAKSGFSIAMGDVSFRSSAATELANVFLVEKDWPKAYRYAQKALAYHSNNIEALEVSALASRKIGNTQAAQVILGRIAALDATSTFQKFETFQLSNEASDEKQFVDGVTNELPHESFLDLAIEYYKKGFLKEAVAVLTLAPSHPIVNLWLAYLIPDKREAYLNMALGESAEFVFPHRVETAKVCEMMLKDNTHWKLRYYYGLTLWDMQRVGEAEEQFLACGNEPDFSGFYLAKAKFLTSRAERFRAIARGAEVGPEDWRATLALAKYYLSENQPAKAKKIILPFLESHPEQSAIGLGYAQSLSSEKRYVETLEFLENYELLPFEGATVGRDLYNEVSVRAAVEALKNERYDAAIALANKAKLWPPNLGVGRPYDVDERLEDYLLHLAYKGKGDRSMSEELAAKITEYEHPGIKEENSKLYLQLLMLRQNGKEEEAEVLLTRYLTAYPESQYMQWVAAMQQDNAKAERIERSIFSDSDPSMAYDTKFTDKGFRLLLDVVSEIE